jgi:hypothetical protein
MSENLVNETDFLFVPNKEGEEEQVEQWPIAFYTLLGNNEDVDNEGNPTLSESNDNCYAKRIDNVFFIKTVSGQLFNPMGMDADAQKYKKQAGDYVIRWERVSPKTFDRYLMFLRTKNEAHFHLANKEKIYG